MEKKEFVRLMMIARFCDVGKSLDYLAGYQRGLRRTYHGKAFGTEEEHAKYLSLVDDIDPARVELGRGYRDGLQGKSIIPLRGEQ
jgi:hypothetical protein